MHHYETIKIMIGKIKTIENRNKVLSIIDSHNKLHLKEKMELTRLAYKIEL